MGKTISRFAGQLAAALVSADQVAQSGVSEDAKRFYNALWSEQGGKLADEYRLPWEEMCVAARDGNASVAIRTATEFLLALEFGFQSPSE